MTNFALKALVLIITLLISRNSFACINCNREINKAIFNSAFYPNLFVVLVPFIILAAVVGVIAAFANKQYKKNTVGLHRQLSPVPLTATAIILGIGIGGFLDGIVFHQILQWHEMLSNRITPDTFVSKSVNMFWDGIFHAFTLMVTFTGIILLWKLLKRDNIDRSGNLLAGGLLLGFGLFNLLEGIADHQVLKLHNVRELTPDKEAWNIGFLIFSLVLIILGLSVLRYKKTK